MRTSLRLLEKWHREPMIKFIGSGPQRWANHSSTPRPHPSATSAMISDSKFLASLGSASSFSSSSSSSSPAPTPKKSTSSSSSSPKFDFENEEDAPRYLWPGALKIEEAELEAVMTGGASLRG